MLQMMPPGIGEILKKMGRGHEVRQKEFPVNLAEYARMVDTSNEAIRGFQAARDSARQAPSVEPKNTRAGSGKADINDYLAIIRSLGR